MFVYSYCNNCKMTTYKPGKKGPKQQQIVEQMRRQHIDRELFTLDYLNQTMNYIIYNNQSLSSYLEIDCNILDRVISEDVKKVGLHFVQRIKSMKQSCDQNVFLKDLQEYGDFVNYDLPKSYQRDLSFIQSQLREQVQTELATKRLSKQFHTSIGNRMTLNEVNKLNNRNKQEILNSLINNWQMIPEQTQNNLQRNELYRNLFHLENIVKNENEQKLITQNNPIEQNISNKIKLTHKSEVKTQSADTNKIRKITKGPKRHQSSNQQPDEYIPKLTKKLKVDQNPIIIPKPVLTNPQSLANKTQKQTIQSNPLLLCQMAEIDKKTTIKSSNNINSQELNKSIVSQNIEVQSKKQKASDQQNIASNTVPQQRVKRKYNKTPKQQKGDDSKKSKNAQNEQKQKREYHRKQKKQDEQSSSKKKKEKKTQSIQAKKSELQAPFVQNTGLINTLPQKNQKIKEISYVSVAIQTHQKQEKIENKNEVKQQKPIQQVSIIINPEKQRINIFQSIRIEELKQEKHHINPNSSLIGQGNILSESQSLLISNNIRKQSIISRQENMLQSELQVSNPFYTDNHPRNVQQQQNNEQEEQIEENRELDIGEFLN